MFFSVIDTSIHSLIYLLVHLCIHLSTIRPLQGVDQILEEREETEQPLVDPLHGHGRLG